MNVDRFLNSRRFSSIASGISGAYAAGLMLSFGISAILSISNGNPLSLMTILSSALSIVFYIFVCNSFLKARSHFYFATSGISALLICNYVLPAILNIVSLVTVAIVGGILTSVSIFASLGTGIAYFIFLFVFIRKRRNGALTGMMICGLILFILSVFSLVIAIPSSISLLVGVVNSGLTIYEKIMEFLIALIEIITSILSILFGVIYFLYPLVLKREL